MATDVTGNQFLHLVYICSDLDCYFHWLHFAFSFNFFNVAGNTVERFTFSDWNSWRWSLCVGTPVNQSSHGPKVNLTDVQIGKKKIIITHQRNSSKCPKIFWCQPINLLISAFRHFLWSLMFLWSEPQVAVGGTAVFSTDWSKNRSGLECIILLMLFL